jgi:hypothetical protein
VLSLSFLNVVSTCSSLLHTCVCTRMYVTSCAYLYHVCQYNMCTYKYSFTKLKSMMLHLEFIVLVCHLDSQCESFSRNFLTSRNYLWGQDFSNYVLYKVKLIDIWVIINHIRCKSLSTFFFFWWYSGRAC